MSELDIAARALALQHAQGLVEQGNIDTSKRKVLKNPDGSFSTESSFSIGIDGGEVLLPSVVNGVRLSTDDAVKHYKKTGEHLGVFSTPQDADAYAQKLHELQGVRYKGL